MDIIEEIRSGNKEVVKQIYKENAKDVYNFAKTITGEHDSALEATKRTFVVLFTNIRNGETPTNIRLAALKIAYDEACAIAMPSTDQVASPYESSYEETVEDPNKEPEDEVYVSEKNLYVPDEDAPISVPLSEEPDEDVQDLVVEDLNVKNEPEETPVPVIVPVPIEEEPAEQTPYEAYKANAGIDESAYGAAASAAADQAYEEAAAEAGQQNAPEGKKKKSVGFIIFLVLDIILVVILLWFVFGLLINLNILPHIDLGYSWFNSHIYNLFWL